MSVLATYNRFVVPRSPFRMISHWEHLAKGVSRLGLTVEEWRCVFREVLRCRGLQIHGKLTMGKLLRRRSPNHAPYAIRVLEGEFSDWEDPRLKPGDQPGLQRILQGQRPVDWLQPPEGMKTNVGGWQARKYCDRLPNFIKPWLLWRLGGDLEADSHFFARMHGLLDPLRDTSEQICHRAKDSNTSNKSLPA